MTTMKRPVTVRRVQVTLNRGSSHSRAWIAKQAASLSLTKDTSKRPSTHTKTAASLKASVIFKERTSNVTPDLQTTSYTLANSPREKLPDHDDIQIIKLRAAVLTDASIAGQTQVTARSTLSRGMKAKISELRPTSGAQIATPAPTAAFQHSGATTSLSTEQTEINPATLAAQGQGPSIDDQIIQSTSEVYKVTSTRIGTAPSFTSDPATSPDYLRWNVTPFSLESIGGHLYCPRLEVESGTALSPILPPAYYPLDSAVIRIREHGIAGNPLPCEARRILIVYGEIRRLDLSDTNITLLDPKLFSSLGHSDTQRKAFHKELGDSIALLGHETEMPDEFEGMRYLKSIHVDYAQLQMSMTFTKGVEQMVVTSPSAPSSPPRSETPQAYQSSGIDRLTLQEIKPTRGMVDDIVFCHYWMKKECNSEDICIVIRRRNNRYHLESDDIDLLSCLIFQELFHAEGTGLIRWLKDLGEDEKQRWKERFWKDLELAKS